MLAGPGNFLQTVFQTLCIVDMGRGNGGHTDNPIHGCTDIVGHIGQKLCLGPVGSLRHIVRCLQRQLLLAFFLDQVIHISGSDHSHKITVTFLNKGYSCLKIHDTVV